MDLGALMRLTDVAVATMTRRVHREPELEPELGAGAAAGAGAGAGTMEIEDMGATMVGAGMVGGRETTASPRTAAGRGAAEPIVTATQITSRGATMTTIATMTTMTTMDLQAANVGSAIILMKIGTQDLQRFRPRPPPQGGPT